MIDDHVHADHYRQIWCSTRTLMQKNCPEAGYRVPGCCWSAIRDIYEISSWQEWKRDFFDSAAGFSSPWADDDPDNFTLRVLKALPMLERESLKLV